MTDAEIVARIPVQVRINLPFATWWFEPPFVGERHALVAQDVGGTQWWVDRVDGSVAGTVDGRVHLVSPDLSALAELSAAFRVASAGAAGASGGRRRQLERKLLRAVGRIDPALADRGTFWSLAAATLGGPPASSSGDRTDSTGFRRRQASGLPGQRHSLGARSSAAPQNNGQVPAQSRQESRRHRHSA